MVAFTGKTMNATWAASDIPDVLDWSVDDSGDVATYRSSDTSGGTGRVDGADDLTATVRVAQGTAAAITSQIKKGDVGTLALYENGTLFWSFAAICTGVQVAVSAEGNEVVGYDLAFGWAAQTGSVTRPTP